MRTINRNELREQGRKQSKMQKWFSSWNDEQLRFHKEMVSKSIDEVEKITEQVLDSCFISAMVQYLDLELNECIEVAKLANENMLEVKEIIGQNGEEYFKIMNDEKLRGKIKEEIKILIGEKKLMSAEVPTLNKKYIKTSIKDLTIMWAEAKAEMKADKEKEEVMKKIGKENERILNKGQEIPYVVTEKEIEENREKLVDFNGVMIKEKDLKSARELTIESEIKTPITIKKVSETFRGADGDIYEKSIEGVKTSRRTFKDIKDLEQYKVATQAGFSYQIKELEEKLKGIREKELKEVNFVNEVEQIFNM